MIDDEFKTGTIEPGGRMLDGLESIEHESRAIKDEESKMLNENCWLFPLNADYIEPEPEPEPEPEEPEEEPEEEKSEVTFGLMKASPLLGTAAHSADEITLSVTPSTVQTTETYTISLSAPGAEKIELYATIDPDTDQSYEYKWNTWDRESVVIRSSGLSAVKQSLSARACFDGEWTEKTVPISFEITSNGPLAKINAIVPDSVTEGSPLVVSFAPVEHATYYTYCYKLSSVSYCSNSKTISSGTTQFEIDNSDAPGSYILILSANGTGYDSSTATYPFEIDEAGAVKPDPPTVTLKVGSESLLAGQSAQFTLVSPEPEKIGYLVTGPNNYSFPDTRDDLWSNDGKTYNISVNVSTGLPSGVYSAKFRVMKNGVWSNYSDAISYNVTYYGTLAKPEVTVSENITAGEDLTVTFNDVENATRYSISVYSEADDYITGKYLLTAGGTYSVILEGLEEGNYKVQVYAYADGYSAGISDSVPFTIAGGELPSAPTVTASATSCTSNEKIDFTVTAPGASKIQYKIGSGGYGEGNNPLDSQGDTTVVSISGQYLKYGAVTFSALIDDVWSSWSEGIVITVTESPVLEKPSITVASPVISGQPVKLSIGAVEHADRYAVFIVQGDEYLYSKWHSELAVSINNDLAAGDYAVQVYANDSSGVYSNSKTAYADLKVIQSQLAPPTLTKNKEEIFIHEEVDFTAAVTEGTTVEFVLSRSGYEVETKTVTVKNGMAGYRLKRGETGDFILKARVSDGENWSDYCEELPFTISTHGKLAAPSTDIPDEVTASKDLVFLVTAQAESEYTYVSLWRWSDDPEGEKAEEGTFISSYTPDVSGGSQYTIPGTDLPEGIYEIRSYSFAVGWTTSETYSKEFKAVGESHKLALTLTGNPLEILTAETVTFALSGENVLNYIEVEIMDNGEHLAWVPLDTDAAENTFAYSKWITKGTHEIYARYNEVESEKITVTVNSEGTLQTPAISAEIIQSMADQENQLKFTIEPVAYADGYLVNVVSKNDPENNPVQWDIPYNGSEPYETSGSWNRAGVYVLSCTAYGKGYEPSEASESIEVETVAYALHARELAKGGEKVKLIFPVVRTLNMGSGIVGDDASGATKEDPLIIPVNSTKTFYVDEDPIDLPTGSSRTIYWIMKNLDDPDAEEVIIAEDSFVMTNQTMSNKFTEMGNFVMYWVATVDDVVVSFTRDWYIKVTGPVLTAAPTEVYVGEEVTFDVEHQDPTGTVKLYAAGIEEPLLSLELNDKKAQGTYAFQKSGTYTVTAKVDGYESAPVTITVKYIGILAAPTVTVESEVLAGEDTPVSWTRVENAQTYDLRVTIDGVVVYEASFDQPADGDLSAVIPGGKITGTGKYNVEVIARAPKYDPGTGKAEFTASESVMNFTMSPLEVKAGNPVRFVVTATGAEKVRLVVDSVRYDEYTLTNGKVTFDRPFYRSGREDNDYYRYVTFDTFINGEWVDGMPTKKLRVTSDGKLDDIVVTAPGRILFGNALPFSWVGVDHAESYFIYFTQDGKEIRPTVQVYAEFEKHDYSYTIPDSDIPEPNTYTVTVMAVGKDYDQSEGSARVEVTGSLPGPKILVPQENEELDTVNVTAQWETVDGATSYSISLAKKNENGEFVKVWAAPNETVNVGTDLSYPLSGLVFGGEYRMAVSSNMKDEQTGEEKALGWSERLFSVGMPSITITVSPEAPSGMEKEDLEVTVTVKPKETVAYLQEPDGNQQIISGVTGDDSVVYTYKLRQEVDGTYTYTVVAYGTGIAADMAKAEKSFTVTFLDANAAVIEDVHPAKGALWAETDGELLIRTNQNVKRIVIFDETDGKHQQLAVLDSDTTAPEQDAQNPGSLLFRYTLSGNQIPEAKSYRFGFYPINPDNQDGEPFFLDADVLEKGVIPAPVIKNLADGEILFDADHTVEWEAVTAPDGVTLGGYFIDFYQKNAGTGAWDSIDHKSVGMSQNFRLHDMVLGGEYRFEVFGYEQGKEPHAANKDVAVREFSYMTIPAFRVTKVDDPVMPGEPVTATWDAPVWSGHPEMKPDQYVVWWYGDGLEAYDPGTKAMAVSVDSSTLSCTLDGAYTKQAGGYSFAVYALLARSGSETQTKADGPDSFDVVKPEIYLSEPSNWKTVNPSGEIHLKGSVSYGIEKLRVWLWDTKESKFLKLTKAEEGFSEEWSHVVHDLKGSREFEFDISLADHGILDPAKDGRYILNVYGFLPGRSADDSCVQVFRSLNAYSPYLALKEPVHREVTGQKASGGEIKWNEATVNGSAIRVSGESYYGFQAIHVMIRNGDTGEIIRLKGEEKNKAGEYQGYVLTTVRNDEKRYKGTFEISVEPETPLTPGLNYVMYVVGYLPWQDHVDPSNPGSEYKSFPQSTFGYNVDYFEIRLSVREEQAATSLYIRADGCPNGGVCRQYKDLYAGDQFRIFMEADRRVKYAEAGKTAAEQVRMERDRAVELGNGLVQFNFGYQSYAMQGHYVVTGQTNYNEGLAGIDMYVRDHVSPAKTAVFPQNAAVYVMPDSKYGVKAAPAPDTGLTILGECGEYWYVTWNDGYNDGYILKSELPLMDNILRGFITPEENRRIAIWNGENLQISWYEEPLIDTYYINIYGSWVDDNGSTVRRWLYSSNALSGSERNLVLSYGNFSAIPKDRDVQINIQLMGSANGSDIYLLYERNCAFEKMANGEVSIGNDWWYELQGNEGLHIWNSQPDKLTGKYYVKWENLSDGKSVKEFKAVELCLTSKNKPNPYDKVYGMSSTLKMQKGMIYRVSILDMSSKTQASFSIFFGEDGDIIWSPAAGEKIKAWSSGVKIFDIRWRKISDAVTYDVIVEVTPPGAKSPVELFRTTVDSKNPSSGLARTISGVNGVNGKSMEGFQITINQIAQLKNFSEKMKESDLPATVRIVVHK